MFIRLATDKAAYQLLLFIRKSFVDDFYQRWQTQHIDSEGFASTLNGLIRTRCVVATIESPVSFHLEAVGGDDCS
jgi:hypothetical protein